MSIGLFEASVGSVDEQERARQIELDKLRAATVVARQRFAKFLNLATSSQDFRDRVALVKEDMRQVVSPYVSPRASIMRRICKQLEREWRHQRRIAEKDDKPLVPKGDFKGYLEQVDHTSDDVDDHVFIDTGDATEHNLDPADHIGERRAARRIAGTSDAQRFVAWCRRAGLRPTLDALDRYAAQTDLSDERYLKVVSALQRRTKDASLRIAAPDYLQKAKEALTGVLNQKAEEFQESLTPLQQALMIVEQALAEQQAANPFNPLPGGQLNVMPNANPSGPPPGQSEPSPDELAAMGMGMADPGMSGLPPALGIPVRASRRRVGYDDFYTYNDRGTGEGEPLMEADLGSPYDADIIQLEELIKVLKDPAERDYFSKQLKNLRQKRGSAGTGIPVRASRRRVGYDDFYTYNDRGTGEGEPLMEADLGSPYDADIIQLEELIKVLKDPAERDYFSKQLKNLRQKRGSAGTRPKVRARRDRASRTAADVVTKWEEWQRRLLERGGLPTGSELDFEQFAKETDVGPQALRKLKKHVIGDDSADSTRSSAKKEASTKKQSWTGFAAPRGRKVEGWEWDDYLDGYVGHRPAKFACVCGDEFEVPSGFHRCACGKQWNSYVIGTGGERHEASAEKFIVREVPVRENVIVAKQARDDDGSPRTRQACNDDGDDRDDEDDSDEKRRKDASFARFVAEAYAAREAAEKRTGGIADITEPGEITETEDDGTPTMKQVPEDWANRNPDGTFNNTRKRKSI